VVSILFQLAPPFTPVTVGPSLSLDLTNFKWKILGKEKSNLW
jgi:hypothetical protein